MKQGLVLLAVIWLAGCATITTAPTVITVTEPEKQFQDASLLVKEKRYKEATAAYSKIMADAADSPVAADALFELSLVSLYLDNPQRDTNQASRSFSDFVKRYPDHKRAGEARTWIAVFKNIQELKKQNEHLSESIEELQKLDIRHEEKRRKGK